MFNIPFKTCTYVIYKHASVCLSCLLSSKYNLVQLSVAVKQAFRARSSGVRAQNSGVNETCNRQGFKTQGNNVLLWFE